MTLDQQQARRAGTHRDSLWFTTRRVQHSWMTGAACVGRDPEMFFPNHKRWLPPEASEAVLVCRACPVRRQCLELALAMDTQYGVWGGLIPLDRSRVRRRAGDAAERRARAQQADLGR